MAKTRAASVTKRNTPQNLGGANDASLVDNVPKEMPSKEKVVLNTFREYLMTPGKMLCLSSLDRDAYRTTLANLVAKKLLVAEQFRDGYSLTDTGFAAMMDCQSTAS